MKIEIPRYCEIDFETAAIERRPEYPPVPAGVAIGIPAGRGKKMVRRYYAWNHPTENNCTKQEAVCAIRAAMAGREPVFHNAKFDSEVMEEHLGIRLPDKYHDTMFLAFLNDPREPSLRLKDLGAEYLGLTPEEQMKLRGWILANVPEATGKNWGAYIARAPGKLVGQYASGDILRTGGLFELLYPVIAESGMLPAYERELKLMPIVRGMERRGIWIDEKRLRRDMGTPPTGRRKATGWYKDLEDTEKKALRRIGQGSFNLASSSRLAEMLTRAKLLTHQVHTAKGNVSTKVEVLEETLKDRKLLALLQRRSVLAKYIGTYGEVWLERAARGAGVIYPRINQIRGDYHGSGGREDEGTYTGRFSMSDPSFHNVPRNNDDPTLPFLRRYVIPAPGCVFLKRDYSQQELRILAHFEQGGLMRKYLENPKADAHTLVKELIKEIVGIDYPRTDVKTTNFGLIYGMGTAALSRKLHKTMAQARQLKGAVLKAIPGAKKLMDEYKRVAQQGEPIRTWGGRLYYVEEPKFSKKFGRMQTFEYKLLNTEIQGSAADNTKEAMINVDAACASKLTLQVHDELVNTAKKGTERKEMARMREAMSDVEFRVPMLSDGTFCPKCWADGKKVDW